ncbi:hypothetical protein A167_00730 [Alcanivorax sp. S71-1-4]|nr:hypothetical protein A167_00730 [Alcanivorax sp. S71-1-4]
MSRDLSRDQDLFNRSEKWETGYVVGCYPEEDRQTVRDAIKKGIESDAIKNMTHLELYNWIEEETGLPVPVANPRG